MTGRRLRRVWRIVDDLAGRSHHRVVGILLRQLEQNQEAVDLAVDVVTRAVPSATGRARMGDIEHAGDDHRRQLVVELAASLTTPIDREDLFRLSRSIDDVLDNLRDFVRENDLFGAPTVDAAVPALIAVREGLALLRRALQQLVDHPTDVADLVLAVRKRAGVVRRVYQEAIGQLLAGDVTSEMLRQRELLRRIDVVGLRLAECCDALADAMLKRIV
ncbi:DUF47 domain-containing protein [Micromonospora sp. CA-111912]|uniref:DUF47 domain-containing protein n=1 Tax=Micromonospora sp. CA-111912 TaxID=3239955 RepID=UPI003D949450